jgi:hypothetical protein
MSLSHWIGVGVLALSATALPAAADVLKIGEQDPIVVQDGERPQRGMSQTQVEARFGAPTGREGPVGEPPISRWIYPGYTVYFEHQYVLHAVDHSAKATQPAATP